jgi:integrase
MPWIDDDAIVRRIMGALKRPADLMFYLGNRSGLRVGEICGLRMSDLAELEQGRIRVRFSYDSCLKEDKGASGTGKTKWAPAPDDASLAFKSWLEQRKAEGAGPEALVFPRVHKKKEGQREELVHDKQYLERAWKAARMALAKDENKLGLKLTFYQATRHSFVSRNLSGGATLDEVTAAVGHSSPLVTRRYYDHFVRRDFAGRLRSGLGLTGNEGGGAEVLPFKKPAKLHGARHGARLQSSE